MCAYAYKMFVTLTRTDSYYELIWKIVFLLFLAKPTVVIKLLLVFLHQGESSFVPQIKHLVSYFFGTLFGRE